MAARIIPFLGFMAFIGIEELLDFLRQQGVLAFADSSLMWLYPVKVAVTALLLAFFYRQYQELSWRDLARWRDTLLSLVLGLVVFVLWINMEWSLPFAGGEGRNLFNPGLIEASGTRFFLVGSRLAGAVLVVPLMEELFWRSFLLRYLQGDNFLQIEIGRFTWFSCLATVVLFGLEHHLFYAGLMAGLFYNLLLYRTKSIAQCTLAHAVTNLALGLYVLASHNWSFW